MGSCAGMALDNCPGKASDAAPHRHVTELLRIMTRGVCQLRASSRPVFTVKLLQRQPGDLAGAVAVIAVGRPTEGRGQFPFLRFVAPLNGGVGDNVVGLAV